MMRGEKGFKHFHPLLPPRKFHVRFHDTFFVIGLDCARRPWLVLATGLCVAGALSAGILYLEVTIDPVELWASPQSRSRQEKEYFDANFSPFYRTAQVIIHAEGLKPVSRERESFVGVVWCFFHALTADAHPVAF